MFEIYCWISKFFLVMQIEIQSKRTTRVKKQPTETSLFGNLFLKFPKIVEKPR